MGIEPTYSAWKAEVLPLNYTRILLRTKPFKTKIFFSQRHLRSTDIFFTTLQAQLVTTHYLVEGGGFEPPKVEPADLQSAPFGRSGTPPKIKPRILLEHSTSVNRNTLLRQLFFQPSSRPHKTAKLLICPTLQT